MLARIEPASHSSDADRGNPAPTSMETGIPVRCVLQAHGRSLGIKSFDFGKWLGRGFDEWVFEVSRYLIKQAQSKALENASIIGQARGIEQFFAYLDGEGAQLAKRRIQSVSSIDMGRYASWLGRRGEEVGWKPLSARSHFSKAKAVLIGVLRWLGDQRDSRFIFPKNPFPSSYGTEEGAAPFSASELSRLAEALKRSLIEHHHRRSSLSSAELAVARILVVAMRTGINKQPLLELEVDCLSDGLTPGTQLLRARKHRGRTVQAKAVRGGEVVVEPNVVPMDVVAILRGAIADARQLAGDASPQFAKKVWLFRREWRLGDKSVVPLTGSTFDLVVRKLVAKFNLVGDDGSALQLTIGRCRKTFATIAWRLSDGDPLAVAGALGNTFRVADNNYLRLSSDDLSAAGGFMAAELKAVMSGHGQGSIVVQPAELSCGSGLHLTPSGRCGKGVGSDATRTPCMDFDRCLSCPSFAVVGEEEDLWRLFSYQRYLDAQRIQIADALGEMAADDDSWHAQAVRFIDEFTGRHFPRRLVAAARSRSQEKLHPFWAHELMRARIGKGALDASSVEQ